MASRAGRRSEEPTDMVLLSERLAIGDVVRIRGEHFVKLPSGEMTNAKPFIDEMVRQSRIKHLGDPLRFRSLTILLFGESILAYPTPRFSCLLDLPLWARKCECTPIQLAGAINDLVHARFIDISEEMRITWNLNLTEWQHLGPNTWSGMRKRVRVRDGEHCQYCGQETGPRFHVDHIVPKSRGGGSLPYNLVVACASCNQAKSDKLLEEWSS